MTDEWDEDEDGTYNLNDPDERAALTELLLTERQAQEEQMLGQWHDHVVDHILGAEKALGRELTGKEVERFEKALAGNEGEAIDISDFNLDMTDDDTRRAVMVEDMESMSEGEGEGEGESDGSFTD